MRHQRLNTEELIQQNRQQYNASKYLQQIKEMEGAILLKEKQIKYLNSQINSMKEESSMKISLLQRQVIDLKKELGENRANIVRERRLENEKYQKILAEYRKQQQIKLEQVEKQSNLRFQTLIKEHQQQIHRTQKKYAQLMELQKQQTLAVMNINEQKSHNINSHVSRLEEQKAHLNKLKREAEQKCENYKESIQKLKAQFNLVIQQKDEELNIKNGQIQGLKLQKKLLNQQLQIIKQRQFSSQSFSRQTFEELNQQFGRLSEQNTHLKKQIQEKNDEILQVYEQIHQKELQKMPITQVYECNHLSLINQMTKNLQLKDKELKNLKKVVQQWSSLIGFDKPLSQRLTEITQKSQNVKNLNTTLSESLKQRVKSTKAYKY